MTAVRAFPDDYTAHFYVEQRAGSGRIPRPDLIVLHPEIGVFVIENKGLTTNEIQRVEGTTMTVLRDGRYKQEDPFHQAERVSLRLSELSLKRCDKSEVLFLHTAALPAIHRADFERRYNVSWPLETLFASAIESPAEFRAILRSHAELTQRISRNHTRLSPHAGRTVRNVLAGKAFLYSARQHRDDQAPQDSLASQISQMELGLKEPTDAQRQYAESDIRGQQRLFRGVAGSGKSVLLSLSCANMLKSMIEDSESLFADPSRTPRIAVVCFNKSLVHYLRERIDDRFGYLNWSVIPPNMVLITHFEGLLNQLRRTERSLDLDIDINQKETRARQLCERFDALSPATQHRLGYDAIFIDEAQDLDPLEIALLLRLARPNQSGEKTLIIFYDNAQNIYGRSQPVWEKIGVNIVGGRTVFLDQCKRNTRETLSLAFNVLVGAFAPEGQRVTTRTFADVQSLRQRKLIDESGGVFEISFTERKGPLPRIDLFRSRTDEFDAVSREVRRLVHAEKVLPSDILIIHRKLSPAEVDRLLERLRPALGSSGTVRAVGRHDHSSKDAPLFSPSVLTVSTIASAKGYDAPIVFLIAADLLKTDTEGRASFYVGATRAKLLLNITGLINPPSTLLHEIARTATALGPANQVIWHDTTARRTDV